MHHTTMADVTSKLNASDWNWILSALVLVTAVGCATETPVEQFDVFGRVFINEDPAADLLVRLHAEDESLSDGSGKYEALTEASGDFLFSSSVPGSRSVPAGVYKATFIWPDLKSGNPEDRLQGALADAETSSFVIVVNPKINRLEPFFLEVDPEKIIPVGAEGNLP